MNSYIYAATTLWTVYNTFCVLSWCICCSFYTSSSLSPVAEVHSRRCCRMRRGHAVMEENAHFSSPVSHFHRFPFLPFPISYFFVPCSWFYQFPEFASWWPNPFCSGQRKGAGHETIQMATLITEVETKHWSCLAIVRERLVNIGPSSRIHCRTVFVAAVSGLSRMIKADSSLNLVLGAAVNMSSTEGQLIQDLRKWWGTIKGSITCLSKAWEN